MSSSHTVFMGSVWTLHSGASLRLFIWTLSSLFFFVFSDVAYIVNENEKVSLEGGMVKDQDTITQRLNGLEIQEESRRNNSSILQCVKLEYSESLVLESEGDIVIGGLFPLHYLALRPHHSYSSKPQYTPCSG